MTGPSWLDGILAGIMIITAAYCAGRLVVAAARRRPTERDVDLVHIVMGVAMTGMLVPRLNPMWSGAWVVVFAAATAWFGWRAFRGYRLPSPDRFVHAHHVPHLVMSGAMVYMLAAMPGSGAGGGPGPGRPGMAGAAAHVPLGALVLALFLIGYVMWVGDRLPALAPVRAWTAAPEGAAPGGAAAMAAAAGPDASGPPAVAAPGAPGRVTAAAPLSLRPAAPLSLRLAACCEIAMGIVMGYMLILMV